MPIVYDYEVNEDAYLVIARAHHLRKSAPPSISVVSKIDGEKYDFQLLVQTSIGVIDNWEAIYTTNDSNIFGWRLRLSNTI